MATRTRTAPKTAPKSKAGARTRGSAKTAPKGSAKSAPASRGPSAETMKFAERVVRLRDRDGLAWKAVAAKLGVPYDHNGSSKLRRAYILGQGSTVGVRSAK